MPNQIHPILLFAPMINILIGVGFAVILVIGLRRKPKKNN